MVLASLWDQSESVDVGDMREPFEPLYVQLRPLEQRVRSQKIPAALEPL